MKTTLFGSLSFLALVAAACGEEGGQVTPIVVGQADQPGETQERAPEPDVIASEADVARALEQLGKGGAAEAQSGHGQKFFVVPAGVALFDKSITEWTEEWWKWSMSLPAAENPQFVLDQNCAVGQDDPVFFLPGFSGAAVSERTCNVPFGQLVLFPARTLINDYPCPDPAFEPAEGQSLRDFLADGAAAAIDAPNDLKVTVDGVEVDTTRHRHATPIFNFTGDISLQPIFDSCITGTEQQGVSDGMWLMLALAPGEHTVRMTASAPDGTQGSRTVKVKVAKP